MNSTHHPDPSLPLIHVQWTRYIQVASLTLVLHDHLLTLPQEVDLVWRGTHTRSWPRLIFYAARYACPIALIINTFAILGTNTDELYDTCLSTTSQLMTESDVLGRGWLFFHGWSGYVFFAGVQVISQMRLWAMYRSRKILFGMTIFLLLALAAMSVIEGFGYAHVEVTAEPILHIIHICGPGHLPRYVYTFWIPPIVVETISVILVTYKAILYFRGDAPKEWAGSRLILSLVKHSMIYFIIVLSVYIVNLYVWLRLPINLYEVAIPLTYALPSIAGNRMLLSLRGVFYSTHSLIPGQEETIKLTIVNPDRGLTVQTHDPMKEFDSFFGENSR